MCLGGDNMSPSKMKRFKSVVSYLVTIVSPALITLVTTLGETFRFQHVTETVTVISSITMFVGTCVQVGRYQKNNKKE